MHYRTKNLIEDYTKEVVTQLEYIGEQDFSEIPKLSRMEFFNDTRQSFGCTALVLYGGTSFGKAELTNFNIASIITTITIIMFTFIFYIITNFYILKGCITSEW